MNQKEGLDYFPMECVTDENIKLITAEFGLQAFAIIVKIYQMIYSHHGYSGNFSGCDTSQEKSGNEKSVPLS